MQIKNISKKSLTIILALMLCTGVFTGVFAGLPTTARAATQRTDPIDLTKTTVDGKDTSGIIDQLADQGWKWDGPAKTLTLDGLDLALAGDHALKLPAGSTIVLADNSTNKITLTPRTIGNSAVFSGGNLTIKSETAGTGKLIVDGRNGVGIGVTGGDATIEGGTVNVTSGGAGIWVAEDGSNGGNVIINGGTVNVTSDDTGIGGQNSITISGGTVNATGSGDGNGIGSNGDITISGGTVTATGGIRGISTVKNIYISGGMVTATGVGYGLYATHNLTINGGTVTATGGNGAFSKALAAVPGANYVYKAGVDKAAADAGGWTALPGLIASDYARKYVAIKELYGYKLYVQAGDSTIHENDASGTAVTLPGISWDGSTLTLTNFDFTTDAEKALHMEGGGTIVVNGTNSLETISSGPSVYGIYAHGGLTIQGTGIFNAAAMNGMIACDGIDITNGDFLISGTVTVNAYSGIDGVNAGKSISMNGGTLNAKGGERAAVAANKPAGLDVKYGAGYTQAGSFEYAVGIGYVTTESDGATLITDAKITKYNPPVNPPASTPTPTPTPTPTATPTPTPTPTPSAPGTQKYAIKASANKAAYGTVKGGGTYEKGKKVTLTATPKAGCRFVQWTEGGKKVTVKNEFTLTVSKARTFKAEFAKIGAPVVKAQSNGYNSVKLSWKKIDGAYEYEVYRKAPGESAYKKIGTTKKLEYINKSLKTGETYVYIVRVKCVAGSKTTYGAYSKAVKAKPLPAEPTGVKAAKASGTSLRVSWDKVAGASGYQVYRYYRSPSNFDQIRITKGTSFMNTNLTKGRTYYYKVRSYRMVDGKRVWGAWSKVMKATVK